MAKEAVRRSLREPSLRWLRRLLFVAESLTFGGEVRMGVLLRLIQLHFASLLRRQWVWADVPPHFEDHRIDVFDLAFGKRNHGAYPINRAFYTSEVIRVGDRLLDIGFGDGLFLNRFYSPRCVSVDALEIDAKAYQIARARQAAPNISYHLLDAVSRPFPGQQYDVIVCDGVLGHIAPEGTRTLLEKIRRALDPGGIFVGSEDLGVEGRDHLQYFGAEEEIARLLSRHFEYVETRSCSYNYGRWRALERREAYWRCAVSRVRLEEERWRPYTRGSGDRG